MAGETTITIIGNLCDAPELRFTPAGAAVANFTIASTPRSFDRDSGQWVDGDPLFLRCSLWRDAAENAAESLTKGTRVIATGFLKARSYETKEGEKRTIIEMDVQEIGPSLRWATARVAKAQRGQSSGGWGQQDTRTGQGGWDQPRQGGGDSWNPDTGGGGWGNTSPSRDEPPF